MGIGDQYGSSHRMVKHLVSRCGVVTAAFLLELVSNCKILSIYVSHVIEAELEVGWALDLNFWTNQRQIKGGPSRPARSRPFLRQTRSWQHVA